MGSGKARWKLSFHRSPSSSPSSSFSAEAPPEFLCPISRSLMADPVIVPSGDTFERRCIEACSALDFTPPTLSSCSSPSTPLLLIPNVALKNAILTWCDRSGLPRPAPPSAEAARAIVRRLMPPAPAAPDDPSPPPPPVALREGLKAPIGPDTPPPISVRTRRVNPNPRFSPPSSSASSSSYPSSSSFPSSEMAAGAAEETLTQETPTKAREAPEASPTASCDRLEEEILTQLKDSEPSEQEAAMASLRQATRESRERRLALCTPRLLAALRPMLLSRYAGVQVNAAAALVNLSLEAPNKVRIVRSGAVPPLVDVLKGGHPEARDHAAGALFSLALEEENRAAIGVLGAIEPLIQLFTRAPSSFSSSSSDAHRARRDAGTALYHLSVASTNQSKMARTPGAVKALLALATAPNSDAAALRRLALMVAGNLAGCADGRAALMDAGAVAALVGLMRDAAGTPEEEYCVAALYGMSKGSLRFRGAARAAGAEAVLMRVAEDSGGGRAGVRRQMARRTLRAMRGEDDDAAAAAAAAFGTEFDDDGSIVSEGLVSFRRRHQRDFGTGGGGGGGGSNTTEF
ncbi:U-box domain-containing protein 41 [Ananas comosus]|uniref:RING-type E3 ubiquitin transferase n=1 Tax=Ananas comosus TaxID=4615 RepID=A0A199UIC3_ANACO|nr:U-box domain-containing protein 41 [Ananas comosus]